MKTTRLGRCIFRRWK